MRCNESDEFFVVAEDRELGFVYMFDVKLIGGIYYTNYEGYDYIGFGASPDEAAKDIMFNCIKVINE